MDFVHKIDVQIRFNDLDGYMHVNNAVQQSYYDLGRYEYFKKAYGEEVEFPLIDFVVVIVSVKSEFKVPVFLDDKIAVETKVICIGTKSITFEQRITDTVSGEIKSSSECVMVMFDNKTGTSRAVTEKEKKLLVQYQGLII